MAEAAGANRADGVSVAALIGFTVSALSPVASVFISGAGVLRLAGSGAALGLILGAAIALLAAVLYAEVASNVPHAGGIYAGVRATLGPLAGFMVMGLALLTAPAYLAFSAQGFAAAVTGIAPGMSAAPVAVLVIAVSAGLALLRLRTNIAITGLLLGCELVAIGVLGVVAVLENGRSLPAALAHPVMLEAGRWPVPVDAARLAIATIAGTFCCSGSLWGAYLGEDTAGTPTAFGRGLAWSALIGAALVAVPLVLAALAVSPRDLAAEQGPLIALIRRGGGGRLAVLVDAAIAMAILNNLLTMTIALARLVTATARDGFWPARIGRSLARLSPRTGASPAATLALAVTALPLLLVPNQRLLVLLAAEVVTPVLIALVVLVGRRGAGGRGYRSPFHPALPLIGLLIAATVVAAEWQDQAVGRPGLKILVVIAAVLALLFQFRRERGERLRYTNPRRRAPR